MHHPHIATQSRVNIDIWEMMRQEILIIITATRTRSWPDNVSIPQPLSADGMLERNAIHPHWTGVRPVSENGTFLWHKGTGSIGTYELRNGTLTAHWYDFPIETFLDVSGYFVSTDVVAKAPSLDTLTVVMSRGVPALVKKIDLKIPRSDFSAQLRITTTDIAIYNQIFVSGEYDSDELPQEARTIVDLGANIGLATIFFALRYPNAEILSVEPDLDNFWQLLINVSPIAHRVKTLRAAAWSRDGVLSLIKEDEKGHRLGSDAIQVRDQNEFGKKQCPVLLNVFSLKTVKHRFCRYLEN